jgi:hypothetical protein
MHTFLSIVVALAVLLVVLAGWLTPALYRWRVVARAPIWLGMIALNLAFTLAGFILCAVMPAAPRADPDGVTRTHWTWYCMWLWDNAIDGCDGWPQTPGSNPNWRVQTADWSQWRRRWVWSAWRNSGNNFERTRLGRSPGYADPPKHTLAFLTDGAKFWLCVPLDPNTPWWELWLGWKPRAGFKATITNLAKAGA